MTVNPENLDFTGVEDVTDIEPQPTLAIGEDSHYFGSIGAEGKALLSELFDMKSDDEPADERVFARLGVGFSHTRWRDFDLYWADDENAFVDALREWKTTQEMAGPAHRGR